MDEAGPLMVLVGMAILGLGALGLVHLRDALSFGSRRPVPEDAGADFSDTEPMPAPPETSAVPPLPGAAMGAHRVAHALVLFAIPLSMLAYVAVHRIDALRLARAPSPLDLLELRDSPQTSVRDLRAKLALEDPSLLDRHAFTDGMLIVIASASAGLECQKLANALHYLPRADDLAIWQAADEATRKARQEMQDGL
jgi:hypothetical protein